MSCKIAELTSVQLHYKIFGCITNLVSLEVRAYHSPLTLPNPYPLIRDTFLTTEQNTYKSGIFLVF